MAARKIQSTTNSDLFERSEDNRDAVLAGRKKLIHSMEKYGFIPSFPVVVKKGERGKLVIVDGQHRYAVARHLKLPVYYVEETTDFVTAEVNETMKTWQIADYVQTWARNGHQDYIDAQLFAHQHGISIGKACSILAGTVSTSNIDHMVKNGTFKIKDREWAEMVATVYVAITKMSKDISKTRFLEACMAVTRVKGFDAKRLIDGAKGCREKLAGYSTRDGNLEMMEEIYNFRRKQLFPLKFSAIAAMRERNLGGNGDKRNKCKSA